MRRSPLTLLLLGCHAAPAPAPAPSRPVIQHACPPLSIENAGYWQAELFPGCQDEPFESGWTWCAGRRCDPPCQTTSARIDGATELLRHEYRNGRWAATRNGLGPDVECHDEDGRRAWCAAGTPRQSSYRAVRDGQGRITAIELAHHSSSLETTRATTIISRDDLGRVVAIGDHTLAYGDDGRLMRFGDSTFEWDGPRVARRSTPRSSDAFEYDPRGRVIRIEREHDDALTAIYGSRRSVVTIEYDGDRPRSWNTPGYAVTFDYACAGPPVREPPR